MFGIVEKLLNMIYFFVGILKDCWIVGWYWLIVFDFWVVMFLLLCGWKLVLIWVLVGKYGDE